jgi:broad specificity phosphatase PhoE
MSKLICSSNQKLVGGLKLKLYFVRHGETYLNKYKKMQGWSDAPLTPEGEEVACKTGKRLKDIPFSAIYTSDLGRTIQTAKLILSENKYCKAEDIQPMREFRETFYGSFEAELGKNVYPKIAAEHKIELKDVFGKLSLSEISNTMKKLDPFDDAESSREFEKRLAEGLAEITNSESEDAEVLVVTHGNTIRHIVHAVSPETDVFQEIGNSSVTTIEYLDGDYHLIEFNC